MNSTSSSLVALVACLAQGAAAAAPAPLAPWGAISPIDDTAERPDSAVRYRVVFSITAAAESGKANPSLEKVARFLNLLSAAHVKTHPGDLVAVVSGAATSALIVPREGEPANPTLELVAALQRAGVTVAVCSQALAHHHFARAQLAPGVRVDASAMTTVTTLQLRGWALLPD